MLLSLIFLTIAHLLLAYASTVVVFVAGTIMWGLHMGFSQGLLGAMIARVTPDGLKGSAFGAFNLATGLVMLVANTAAGWFWHRYGSEVPFLVGAAISAGSAVALLLMRDVDAKPKHR